MAIMVLVVGMVTRANVLLNMNIVSSLREAIYSAATETKEKVRSTLFD